MKQNLFISFILIAFASKAQTATENVQLPFISFEEFKQRHIEFLLKDSLFTAEGTKTGFLDSMRNAANEETFDLYNHNFSVHMDSVDRVLYPKMYGDSLKMTKTNKIIL